MNELFEQAKELQEEGYSLREIAEQLGISKSKVHRILTEEQEKDTSQNGNETFFETSQNVPKTTKKVKRTEKDTENDEFEQIENKKNSLKEIRKKEHLLKERLDPALQDIIDEENFTLDELNTLIKFLGEIKSLTDEFYTEKLELDSKVHDNASQFLKELIRFLKRPTSKLKSMTFKELKNEREFKFVESLRTLEYDDEDETDEEYDEQIEVIAVQLFSSYRNNDIKEKIEDFLEAKNLDKVGI